MKAWTLLELELLKLEVPIPVYFTWEDGELLELHEILTATAEKEKDSSVATSECARILWFWGRISLKSSFLGWKFNPGFMHFVEHFWVEVGWFGMEEASPSVDRTLCAWNGQRVMFMM